MQPHPSAFSLAVLVLGIFGVSIGVCVFAANTKRLSNKAFLIYSIILGAWLICVYKLSITPRIGHGGEIKQPLKWIRANAAVASLMPWSIWLIKESVISRHTYFNHIFIKSSPWIATSVVQILMVYSDSFVFLNGETIMRGFSYFAYNSIIIITCLFFIYNISRQLKSEVGLRKVEMQFFILTTFFSCAIIFILNLIGNILHQPILNRLSIFVILIGHGLTGWGIAFYRVFDARQILLSLAHRIAIVMFVSGGTFGAWYIFRDFNSTGLIVFAGAALFGAVGIWLHEMSLRMLDISGNKALIKARGKVIELARREVNPDAIASNFEKLLYQQFHANSGVLLLKKEGKYAGGGLSLLKGSREFDALCAHEWITQGRIERQPATKDLSPLADLMTEHGFALLVTIPRGSRTPSLIIALGEKTDGWVFTYPEIQRVQNLGELMDNILTHSHLASQAALKARMEHTAFMSRGLAHDLKNLITPVSSFLVYAQNNFRMTELEAEGHASARRSIKLMTDYVRQVMSFADQLAPTLEKVDLSDLARVTFNACKERADSRGVTLASEVTTDVGVVADFVLLQRMLGNLMNNAIDASPAGSIVTLSILDQPGGAICLRVSDHGTGIAPAHLSRIFEPYFTTKQLGDNSRGFGLGLTVAQKIVQLHHGTLTVDSEFGRGTCVSVVLPVGATTRPVLSAECLEPVAFPIPL